MKMLSLPIEVVCSFSIVLFLPTDDVIKGKQEKNFWYSRLGGKQLFGVESSQSRLLPEFTWQVWDGGPKNE